MLLGTERPETAGEIRLESVQRRAQTRELRKQNLMRMVRRGFICPGCGVWVDIHGRFAYQYPDEPGRWWPCSSCGYGEGQQPPELAYKNPQSGVVYDEAGWQAFLDSPRR
jgi:hypothetical protein